VVSTGTRGVAPKGLPHFTTARRARTTSGFLLAGQGLGLLMCTAATCGEWLGGTSTVGIAEGGFGYGLSAAWFTLANSLGRVLFAFTLARTYRRWGEYTVPGIIERYLDVRCRVAASVVLAFAMIIVGSLQVVGAGAIMTATTGMGFKTAVIVTGMVFIAYTLAGGLWAVSLTNIVHLAVMYAGMLTAFVLVFSGQTAVAQVGSLPVHPFFSMFGAGSSKVVAWIISASLGVFTAQAGLQPLLAARDEGTARRSALLAAAIAAPFGFIAALVGMFVRATSPDLPARMALPSLVLSLPPAAGGLVLAGILAAILSTVAPCVLAAGTLLIKDLYCRALAPEAVQFRASRLITLGCGLLTVSIALYAPAILEAIYFAYTLRASIFIIIAAAILWRRTTPQGAFWGLSTAAVANGHLCRGHLGAARPNRARARRGDTGAAALARGRGLRFGLWILETAGNGGLHSPGALPRLPARQESSERCEKQVL